MKYKCCVCGQEFDCINEHLEIKDDTAHREYARQIEESIMKPVNERKKCFCGGIVRTFIIPQACGYISECMVCGYIAVER